MMIERTINGTRVSYDPDEILEDIAGLCSKVAVDNEAGNVRACDLVELRNLINAVRAHVSQYGYKSVPGLSKDDES